MRSYFPKAVSYRRFVCLANVCRLINDTGGQNLRGYDNKVFKGITADGKGTWGWCRGFKRHLVCNDRDEEIDRRKV